MFTSQGPWAIIAEKIGNPTTIKDSKYVYFIKDSQHNTVAIFEDFRVAEAIVEYANTLFVFNTTHEQVINSIIKRHEHKSKKTTII